MPHRISEKGTVWVDKDQGKLHEKGEISAEAWRDHQNLIDGERSRLCWEPEKKSRRGKERQESRSRNQGKKKKKGVSFLPSALASALGVYFYCFKYLFGCTESWCGTWNLVP